MIGRRPFLLGGLAAAAGVALPSRTFARPASDMFVGWATPPADSLAHASLTIEGRLPDDLVGILRRNGPAVHDRHGLRYEHWFDGDGMMQEFVFSGASVSHRGRVIHTPKLQREDKAGRRLFHAFGTDIPDALPARRPDDLNVANTSLLDHNGELLALWEGGSASVLDRDTLDWTGFRSWGPGLEGLPFTAHPKVEADGTVWAFGFSLGAKPAIVLYHIGADGVLVKATALPVEPLGMVHDFVITERHLVIVLPPFVHEPGHDTFLGNHAWRPELGSRVLIVSKDDFADRRWEQLPAGFGFHHGNGWEDAGGTIRFDLCMAPDPGLMTGPLKSVMRSELDHAAPATHTLFAIHPDGRTRIEQGSEPAEFPRVASGLTGLRNRYVYLLTGEDRPGWPFSRVTRRDLENGRDRSFEFGPDRIPEEHVFVPFPGSRNEDQGWLVGTVLDWRQGRTGVTVFDARHLDHGPLATAWLPYPLPLGLHGQFSHA